MLNAFNLNDIVEMKAELAGGEEAIAWQKTSKVGEQMIALFDKCKAYRAKHFKPQENNWKSVANDISKIIEKELPPIWKKELGLNIKAFYFNCEEPSGFIAIDYMSLEDVDAVYLLHERTEGSIGKSDIPSNYIKRMNEMINKAKSFDRLEGKLKKDTWNIILYIDVTLFFFYDLFCPKSLVADGTITAEITSREATGILLHEAGHAMLIIERIAYSYSTQLLFTNLMNGFLKSNPTIEDFRELCVSIIGPTLNTILGNPNNEKLMKEKAEFIKIAINKIVSFCDYLSSIKEGIRTTFTPGYEDPEVSKVVDTAGEGYEYTGDDSLFIYGILIFVRLVSYIITSMITLFIPLLFTGIFEISIFAILAALNQSLISMDPEVHNANSDKTSDMKGTAHEVYLIERSADEHAIRHGFGGDLASALIKIRAIFALVAPSQNTYIRNSRLLLFLSSATEVLQKLLRSNDNYSCYEWDDMRVRRICQNCISFFKNAKVSPQYRDKMLVSLKHAMDCLDKLNRDLYNRDKSNAVEYIIRNLIMPSEWLRMITSGKLTKEYEQHINQIEDISNNLMFAHSAQFKKILSDMKGRKN